MLNLLNSQRRLTNQLHYAVNERSEPPGPIEIRLEFEDDPNLEDAFNPELDTKEELIEIDEEFVIQEEVIDNTDNCDTVFDITSNKEGGHTVRDVNHCLTCSATFSSKALLQSHKRECHNGKQFVCKICGASRKDEEYLELHMNVHEGKTENECRYCPKRFSRPVNTLRHMRIHWDKKKFQCEKCGERFSLDNMLYNHRMRHEAEDNPVICSICNQSFKSRKTYNHHILIHQENRPRHHCTLCPKSFTERYTLKMHLKTHRDRQSPTSTVDINPCLVKDSKEETEDAINLLVEGDEVGYNCVICHRKFDDKDCFEHHLQDLHGPIFK
ncbi:serendipity locus protein delta isoform X2 [Stomoxys calcitrans]|nr:serendipity locus protein delta isoform X2 [Stomoxys calcitrans]